MSVTQVKTAGIADDAVTLAKQAAGTDGQVITYDASGNPTAVGPGSDGQVLTSTGAGSPPAFENLPASNNYTHPNHSGDVTSSGDGATTIADNAVTLAKMAHGTDGQIITYDASGAPTAVGPGTDGQVLTSTGAGSPPAFEAIPASGKATNLIINGAMNVAQRAASSTAGGYKVMDRWQLNDNNTNVTITQSQHALTSGDSGPWAKGFRNSYSVALSAAGNSLSAASYCKLKYMVEAQDVACSGWDYTSASSYVTLSFWFKCSTNQTFHGRLETNDGTAQNYPFSFTASGNNTWTKITKTIPGHANLTINNDNGVGLGLNFSLFSGTDRTGSVSLNTWAAYSSATRYPDDANTWITAGASTFEITGVQLEVGSTASEFAFKPYAEDLRDCQRYYWKWDHDNSTDPYFLIFAYHASYSFPGKVFDFPVVMRSKPTGAMSGGWKTWNSATSGQQTLSNLNFANNTRHSAHATYWQNDGSNWSQGDAGIVGAVDADCICTFDAEL